MTAVIVIGAGIAGLTAAYRLAQLNLNVAVLEAEPRVGGRMSTDRIEGYVFDRGAQFLSNGYTVIGRLLDELGLSPTFSLTSGWTGIVRAGKVRRMNAAYPWSLAASGLLGWGEMLQTALASLRLLGSTWRQSLSDYSQWAAQDDADASEWIAAAFGRQALEYLFEPMLEGFYFQPPEHMSAAWPAVMWSFALRRKASAALSGGLGSLPEALARRVDVLLSTPALSIETNAAGVSVNTPAGTMQAQYVVLATTASAARRLYAPALEVEKRLLDTGYSATINLSLAVPDGLAPGEVSPDIYGLLLPRQERRVIAAVALEARKCRAYALRGELLNVMLCGSAGQRLIDASETQVLGEVLPELNSYFPAIDNQITLTRFNRWAEAEPHSPTGRSLALRQYRQGWHPGMKVILAGDYLGSPCTEGAAESGQWAAAALQAAISRQKP